LQGSRLKPATLRQSVVAAAIIGIIVASAAVILDSTWTLRATTWYARAIVIGSLQLGLVTLLVTAVLEQWRRQIIRRALERRFLNHHIRNALSQVQLADQVNDRERQHRLVQDAISRVSGTLYRVTNGSDEGLSLEKDMEGRELTLQERTREDRRAAR
jgi:hypothetical protein